LALVPNAQVELDLGPRPSVIWRLDSADRADSASLGIGAKLYGGRWNPRGVACVYASMDAATAILEVAVHKGFDALDTKPHVLTAMAINPDARIRVVRPEEIPNPNWLTPAAASPGQMRFGGDLLLKHPVVLIPSVVAQRSWNVLVNPELIMETGSIETDVVTVLMQERLRLDTRLPGASG
jgi:RES domain-containing protein